MTKFSEILSERLLQIADQKDISQEALAELCNMSTRFMGNIIRGHQVPTLDSFEKICEGLEMTPDKLLLPDRENGMPVTQYYESNIGGTVYVCPSCNNTMAHKYTNYCEHCGQRLIWDDKK